MAPHVRIPGLAGGNRLRPTTARKSRAVSYDLRRRLPVVSSVIRPLSSRPLERGADGTRPWPEPTAAPTVRASAGIRGGMLVRRWFVAAVDEAPLAVERPAGHLADGAEPQHLEQLFARDEAVNMDLRLPIHLADPDQPQVGLGGDRSHLAIGSILSIWSRSRSDDIRNGSGIG